MDPSGRQELVFVGTPLDELVVGVLIFLVILFVLEAAFDAAREERRRKGR